MPPHGADPKDGSLQFPEHRSSLPAIFCMKRRKPSWAHLRGAWTPPQASRKRSVDLQITGGGVAKKDTIGMNSEDYLKQLIKGALKSIGAQVKSNIETMHTVGIQQGRSQAQPRLCECIPIQRSWCVCRLCVSERIVY
jgi:hypothetical protein